MDGLDGLSGLSELTNMAEQLKDAKENPEKAAEALNMMNPDTLGDSMANMMVMAMDKDNDGVLSKEEIAAVPLGDTGDMKGDMTGKAEEMFSQMDLDGDGEVSRKEAKVYFAKLGNALKGMSGMMGSSKKTDL